MPPSAPALLFGEPTLSISAELPPWAYVLLLLGLFVVPRLLQRYRVPRAVSAFVGGGVFGMVFPVLGQDPTVKLFAALGIVSLFLFAGLEVDTTVIRKNARVLALHLLTGIVLLSLVGWAASSLLGLDARVGALVALALFTPSAGFILESLDGLGATSRERFWIRSTVISTELLALGVMFFTLQSDDMLQLAGSAATLGGMILVLPWLFRMFASWVAPYAPKSEFAFLIVVAVACAFLTKKLGVYYLVGAFVVGMAAQRFRKHLPAMASEKMLEGVESFASLFVPFYFFSAGLSLRPSDFQLDALLVGIAFLAIAVPVRIAAISGHRYLVLGESFDKGFRVSVSMMPTLVFTLVIAGLLRTGEQFVIPPFLYGALVVYALVTTIVPTWILGEPPRELDAPTVPAIGFGRDFDEDEEGPDEEPRAGEAPHLDVDAIPGVLPGTGATVGGAGAGAKGLFATPDEDDPALPMAGFGREDGA